MTIQKQLNKGIFIVFEGIDGLGKTTQIQWLAKKYQEQGFQVVQTKEPTNGVWGRQIREIEKQVPYKGRKLILTAGFSEDSVDDVMEIMGWEEETLARKKGTAEKGIKIET